MGRTLKTPPDGTVRLTEAARELGTDATAIYRLVTSGQLRNVLLPGWPPLIDKASLEALLKARGATGSASKTPHTRRAAV